MSPQPIEFKLMTEKISILIKALEHIANVKKPTNWSKIQGDYEWWDSSNFDDAFHDGIEVGEHYMGEIAATALEQFRKEDDDTCQTEQMQHS